MVETKYWFKPAEYRARLARVQEKLRARGLDALLAFQPETVTWVTGYFTRAYGTFQFAIIPAEGEPTLFCRDVEEYYLDSTCVFSDRVMWTDSDNRTAVAVQAITSRIGKASAIGVEMGSWVLNALRWEAIRTAMPNCMFSDETDLVAGMRLIKSDAEIAYQRVAARAAEAGMQAGLDAAGVGVSEREMAAEICAAMIRSGSDLPGPGVLSSGERAYHLHGGYSNRVLERGDIVQLEVTPNNHHYHARFMRPIRVAEAQDEDYRLAETLIEIQDRAIAEVAPGVPATVPDAIYRDGVLSAGLRETYTNKTFYSVGLILQPNGGEPLEAHPGAEWTFEEGMVFHTYVLARGFGMSETILVSKTGVERITTYPRRLLVTN
ncbi:Xaa-Pro peptidase family protein [Tropicimonas sp. IMCC34043]|uniref:M24 family metallopeptidase n=1 Tax=Tropicimonas sp. IMCC34043 TaxID=2248760 RepID=UPI000E21E3B6|nr:Xaa-Pro peptidase family protein [Tropicimonas sp. IMCC34043]